MNEELFSLFEEINPESRNTLEHSFKNSPKMLRLIEFLKTANAQFKTPKAINHIYEEELEEVDYNTLINRFYKLRQQLLEWLYHYLKKTENYTSDEEQTLNFIRYLVNQNQFKDALDRALKLEVHCRKLNLFELLPSILHLIIYCKQCVFSGDNEAFAAEEGRLLEAMDWHQKLQKLQYYYQISYKARTLETYQEAMTTIRKLISPYKDLPRFAFIYHYLAFNRGCMIASNVEQSSNALIRHLNTIEKILEDYPQMPLVFATAHHTKMMTFRLWILKAIFYFQKNKYDKAAAAIVQQERLKKAHPNISFPTSEAELRNTLSIYIANQQYEDAFRKLDELIEFNKKHEQLDRMDFALADKANIFFFQFPKGNAQEREELLQQVQKYPQGERFSMYLNLAAIWLELILGKEVDSTKLKKEKNTFAAYGIDSQLIQQLSKAIVQKNKKELQALIQQLGQHLQNKELGMQKLYYQQLVKIARYYEGAVRG